MFAGLEISLFVLIHRQMMHSLLAADAPEKELTRWFAWYQAAFLFGAAAGGWLFGWLGDRAGRTRAMALSVLCYSLFTFACYEADTPQQMIVLRFAACLGIGGVWPNAVVLVGEAWPAASRPFLAGLLGAAANVGFVLLAALGLLWDITDTNWRWTLLVGASPCALGIFILLVVPESARWLVARSAPAAEKSPLGEVFRPPLLYRTLLGIGLGAIPVIGTAANGNWLTPWADHAASQSATNAPPAASAGAAPTSKDPKAKEKTQIARSGGGILGSFLGGIVASLLGRRVTYFLISLGALTVSSYIFTQLDPLDPRFPFFTFLLGFIGVTFFGWLPLFLPELFPTRVRSTGSGISFNTGRVLAGVVVLSAGLLIDQFQGDYARVGFWSGMIYAMGMAIIWLAPRRESSKLED